MFLKVFLAVGAAKPANATFSAPSPPLASSLRMATVALALAWSRPGRLASGAGARSGARFSSVSITGLGTNISKPNVLKALES